MSNQDIGGDFLLSLKGEQEYPPKAVKTVKIDREAFLKEMLEKTIPSVGWKEGREEV